LKPSPNIPEVPDDARSYCCAVAKKYSASVRCTASVALPQILAAHNGTTRVTIKYRQPLPPARSLHRCIAPILQICSHDLIFDFQISTA
jgi:hypothetical protein